MRLPSSSSTTGRRPCPAFRQAAFSLVEMMVVVAVMSILIALTAKSYSSLRAVSLSSAGNQIVDVAAMARQNSISRNAYTVIAIKSQGPGAYSAYCLLELTKQEDGSLGSWIALTPWRYLGQGLVFESGQATDTFISTPPNLPKALPTAFPFPAGDIDLTSCAAYQCYLPDGTLSTQVTPPTRLVLRLTEGEVAPSGGAFTYLGKTVSGKPVSYYDLVFVGNTGVTRIERP